MATTSRAAIMAGGSGTRSRTRGRQQWRPVPISPGRRRRLRHRSPPDRGRNVRSARGLPGYDDTTVPPRIAGSGIEAPLTVPKVESSSLSFWSPHWESPRRGSLRCDRAGAVPVNADEQEQPDDIDEMPVPGGGFEPEMAFGRKLVGPGAEPAHDQETGADDDMETVEPCREEEDRGVDAASKGERRMGI